MPSSSGFLRRHWIIVAACVAVAIGIATYTTLATVRHAASDLLSPGKQEPVPPAPSEKVLDAPGPDNTIQTLTPRPNVPPQPPSPVKSQSDPSKKLKGG